MRFVDRELGKEVALTHAVDKHLLSRLPSDAIFSGVALVRVKGQRAGTTVLITTLSHVVIYGKEGVIIWKQPLRGLTVESHGLDLIRLTSPTGSLEIGTGLSRRKELIEHLTEAREYSESNNIVADDSQEFDIENIREAQKAVRESSKLEDLETKAALNAARESLKIEAREMKLAERAARTQQRAEEQKAREKLKIAEAKSELEKYGRKVIEEACAGKLVRIYDKGYVRISGVFFKDGAAFEKLVAIEGSADVAKKTALGRTIMFGATMGLNMLTPDKRGDIYLTIATDQQTHMLHMSPPTERDMKAMHKLATAGQGVLDSLERKLASKPTSIATNSDSLSPTSAIDELTKLVALRDAGALTEEEFSAMKSELLNKNRHESDNEDSTNSVATLEQEYFDVELVDAKLQLVEAVFIIRKFTNIGIAEAKKQVESAPSIVGVSLSRDIAMQFVEELRAIGATVELR